MTFFRNYKKFILNLLYLLAAPVLDVICMSGYMSVLKYKNNSLITTAFGVGNSMTILMMCFLYGFMNFIYIDLSRYFGAKKY